MTIEEMKAAIVAEYRRQSIELNGGEDPPSAYWNGWGDVDATFEVIREEAIASSEFLGEALSLKDIVEIHYFG